MIAAASEEERQRGRLRARRKWLACWSEDEMGMKIMAMKGSDNDNALV
jgi:hypothetical protein